MSLANGILDGVGELVDEWLELSFPASTPLYQHKTAALELSRRSQTPLADTFLKHAYDRLETNWKSSSYSEKRPPSRENWRFQRRPEISADNTSPEVGLERAIVQAAGIDWANQIPTSSGLIGPSTDKVRNIDLAYAGKNGHFTLIELKVASNTPLFAAIEILLYGLLLAWSRNNAERFQYDAHKQPLLAAESVELCVLAPARYYNDLDLTELARSINHGLLTCLPLLGIPFSFCFTQFADSFDITSNPEALLKSAIQRRKIWD